MLRCVSSINFGSSAASVTSVRPGGTWGVARGARLQAKTTPITATTARPIAMATGRLIPASTSFSAQRHAANLERRGRNRPAESDVISNHFDVPKHFQKITRNCNLLNCVRKLPILNPQTRHTARVIAIDSIDSKSNQLDNIES